MDLGGVRQKMTRKNCELINAVKMVNGYIYICLYAIGQQFFFKRYGNIALTPTVYVCMYMWLCVHDGVCICVYVYDVCMCMMVCVYVCVCV